MLSVEQVYKSYGAQVALEDVTFAAGPDRSSPSSVATVPARPAWCRSWPACAGRTRDA